MAVQPYKGGQVTPWDASSLSDNEQETAIMDAQEAALAEAVADAGDVTYAPEEPDSPGGYASQTMEYFGYVKAKYKDTAHTAIDQCNHLHGKCKKLQKQVRKLKEENQELEEELTLSQQQKAAEKAERIRLKKENNNLKVEQRVHTAIMGVELAAGGAGLAGSFWSWIKS